MEVPKLIRILHYPACFQKGLFGGSFEQKHPRAFRVLRSYFKNNVECKSLEEDGSCSNDDTNCFENNKNLSEEDQGYFENNTIYREENSTNCIEGDTNYTKDNGNYFEA